MMKASNCVSNLMGTDRDAMGRKAVQGLPTSEDLDRVAEEEKIKNATGVNNTEKDNGI
jgi:hypothetical protein